MIDVFSGKKMNLYVAFNICIQNKFKSVAGFFRTVSSGFGVHYFSSNNLSSLPNKFYWVSPHINKQIQYFHCVCDPPNIVWILNIIFLLWYLNVRQKLTGTALVPNISKSELSPNKKVSGFATSNLSPPIRKCVPKYEPIIVLLFLMV